MVNIFHLHTINVYYTISRNVVYNHHWDFPSATTPLRFLLRDDARLEDCRGVACVDERFDRGLLKAIELCKCDLLRLDPEIKSTTKKYLQNVD